MRVSVVLGRLLAALAVVALLAAPLGAFAAAKPCPEAMASMPGMDDKPCCPEELGACKACPVFSSGVQPVESRTFAVSLPAGSRAGQPLLADDALPHGLARPPPDRPPRS